MIELLSIGLACFCAGTFVGRSTAKNDYSAAKVRVIICKGVPTYLVTNFYIKSFVTEERNGNAIVLRDSDFLRCIYDERLPYPPPPAKNET
jgi:hypothetical protein